MSRTVLLYQKGCQGHRGITQKLIADHLHPDAYTAEIYQAAQDDDFVRDLLRLSREKKVDHCHILTLDDVLKDFGQNGAVEVVQSQGISLSGHLYGFDIWPDPIRLTKDLALRFLRRPFSRTFSLCRLLMKDVMLKVTIMDERCSRFLRYPMWHDRLAFLPDPLFFPVESSVEAKLRARRSLEIPSDVPVFLMFGTMYAYKGLDTLLKAVSDRYDAVYGELHDQIIVVAAGRWDYEPKMWPVSRHVKLILMKDYIPNRTAARWFAAADCVVMPFDQSFGKSSGTFSLACGAGKVVIVPSGGLLAWRVKTVRNGYVFSAGQPSSLAKTMTKFVHERNLWSTPVASSVRYGNKCAPQAFAGALDRVLRQCLISH